MPLYDLVRGRARWARVLPLAILSLLTGIALALGLSLLELLPRWAVTPVGNSIGAVLVWTWLPYAIRPLRPISWPIRILAGLASAVVFVWALVAVSWQNPFWLR
jgi:hypothetical protein